MMKLAFSTSRNDHGIKPESTFEKESRHPRWGGWEEEIDHAPDTPIHSVRTHPGLIIAPHLRQPARGVRPALADPCSDTPYSGCLTDPASYQIKYRFNSTLPLTNIVDMWQGPIRLLRNQ